MALYQTAILDCTSANFHFLTATGGRIHCSLAYVDLKPWWFVYLDDLCIGRFLEKLRSDYVNVQRAHDIAQMAMSGTGE